MANGTHCQIILLESSDYSLHFTAFSINHSYCSFIGRYVHQRYNIITVIITLTQASHVISSNEYFKFLLFVKCVFCFVWYIRVRWSHSFSLFCDLKTVVASLLISFTNWSGDTLSWRIHITNIHTDTPKHRYIEHKVIDFPDQRSHGKNIVKFCLHNLMIFDWQLSITFVRHLTFVFERSIEMFKERRWRCVIYETELQRYLWFHATRNTSSTKSSNISINFEPIFANKLNWQCYWDIWIKLDKITFSVVLTETVSY